MKLPFKYNDGGRKAAGYSGDTGDCATRAIAIATGKTYQEVYDAINAIAQTERVTRRVRGRSNARTGVYRKTCDKLLLERLGAKWVSCMGIGTGCKVHLRVGELPMGRLICRVSRHFVAVIDGIINDTHDCSRDGTRCVYGYWIVDGPPTGNVIASYSMPIASAA